MFGRLDKTRGDLGSVDSRAIERKARAWREDSYLMRQSKEIGDSYDLAAGLLRAMPETGMLRDQAVDVIREKEVSDGPESRRLPKGMDAGDFLDHLIYQGIFQPDRTDLLSGSIPNLRTWLIEIPSRHRQVSRQSRIEAGRDALASAVNNPPEQSEPERKRRSGPDRDRGGEQ